jgi:hypothetical protein
MPCPFFLLDNLLDSKCIAEAWVEVRSNDECWGRIGFWNLIIGILVGYHRLTIRDAHALSARDRAHVACGASIYGRRSRLPRSYVQIER